MNHHNDVPLSDRNVVLGGYLKSLGAFAIALAMVGGFVRLSADEEYRQVPFVTLANWDYNPKEPWDVAPHKASNTIPASVRALDGQKIAIYGTTMPLDYRSGQVTRFILGVSADTCEFGATPRINEWIAVTMASGTKTMVYASADAVVKGVLHISEMVEDNRVVRLYSIDADSVGRK